MKQTFISYIRTYIKTYSDGYSIGTRNVQNAYCGLNQY